MGEAKSALCKCSPWFTCRVCLENAPPYFYTLASGARVYGKEAVDMAAAREPRR